MATADGRPAVFRRVLRGRPAGASFGAPEVRIPTFRIPKRKRIQRVQQSE